MCKKIYYIKGDKIYSLNIASSIFSSTKLKISFTKNTLDHNQKGNPKKLKSFLNNKLWQQQYLVVDNKNYHLDFVTLPTYVTTNLIKEQLQVQYAAQYKLDPSNIVIDYITIDNQKSALLLVIKKQAIHQQQQYLQSLAHTASYILPQDLCWLALCPMQQIENAYFVINYEQHSILMIVVNGEYNEKIALPNVNTPLFATQLRLNLTLLKKKYANANIQTVFYTPVNTPEINIKNLLTENDFTQNQLHNIYDISNQKYRLDFQLCPISASLLLSYEYQKNKPNTYLAIKNKKAFWQKVLYAAGMGIWLLIAAKACLLGVSLANSYASIEPTKNEIQTLNNQLAQNEQQLLNLKQQMDQRAIIGVLTPEAAQQTHSFTQTLMPLSKQKFTDLWVNDIEINQAKEEIKIKGQALSKTELFAFYQKLIQSPNLKDLTIKETKTANESQLYIDKNNQAQQPFGFTLERKPNNAK